MFGWELPPQNTGGLGVACYGLAKGLSRQNVSIAFGLPRPLQSNIPFMDLLEDSSDVMSITAINSLLMAYQTKHQYTHTFTTTPNCKHNHYCSNLYEEANRFGDLGSRWAATKQHGLIHVHDWMTYPAGSMAAKRSGKALIAHIHATEYDRTGGNVDPRIAEIEYQGLNRADHVIAVSNYTKNIIHDKYNVPLEKVTVVHNGIDPVEFSPKDFRTVFPNDKIVLFVGRLTFQKGVDYFLKSAKQVLNHVPNTVFVIAGTGDMEHYLMMESAYLGIGNRVIFSGFIQGKSLQELYHMANVFVMPSVSEPYGIVALEAVAAGVPSIISKQSGVSETLQSVRKVDFWDTHKLADEIIHILKYPQLASEWSHAAKLEAISQTWDKAATKIKEVYSYFYKV